MLALTSKRISAAALTVLLAVFSVAPLPARAAEATTEALAPSLQLPASPQVSATDYFGLLLKWSRDVNLGPTTARVSYLDPALYLAWLKQTGAASDQAAIAKGLAGFPNVLRFRIAYRAQKRPDLKAKDWAVSLQLPNQDAIPAKTANQLVAPDIKMNSSGTYWEVTWEYSFPVPGGALDPKLAEMTLKIAGPSSSGSATWRFGAAAGGANDPLGYVSYLGWTLVGVSVLLGFALIVTRPRVRRS